jgi:hypothetical protein
MPRDDLPFCECRWLERAAHDPLCPVEFDPELNEYNLRTTTGTSMRIYHCPSCAGRAPESLRAQMFATVPPEESVRLHKLIQQVETEADAIRVFGKPTQILEPGGMCTEPEHDGRPRYIHLYRTLRYESVSDTALVDVHIDQYGKATASLCGKYLGRPPKA